MPDTERIILTLTKDKMQVVANYTPSMQENSITTGDIIQKLHSMGVKVGIKEDVIRHICESSITMSLVAVAEGVAPKIGNNARIETLIDFTRPKSIELEDGSVDFKNLGELPFASQGTALYRKIPPTIGESGADVLGNPIPGSLGKDFQISLGKGTELDPDDPNLVLASESGGLLSKSGLIHVLDIHKINGDVNYKTGNIKFKGSVFITGNVKAGFKIEADGNITIEGRVEDAEIIGGNDVVIMGGYSGAGNGMITAGRDVFIKFITNQTVRAERDIVINYNSHHATLFAGRAIICKGHDSMIVGGECEGKMYVEAGSLGSVANPKTIIRTGDDPELTKQIISMKEVIKQTKETNKIFTQTIKKFKTVFKGNLPPDKAQDLTKLEESLAAICKKLSSHEQSLSELVDKKKKLNKSFIIAYRAVYANVEIHIGNQWKKIKDNLNPSVFKIVHGEIFRKSL